MGPGVVTLGVTGHWKKDLEVKGTANVLGTQSHRGFGHGANGGNYALPFSLSLRDAKFETLHIDATFDEASGDITKFHVSGVEMVFKYDKAQISMSTHMRFFEKVAVNRVDTLMKHQGGNVQEKICKALSQKLAELFNEKMKGAINAKMGHLMAGAH